MNLEIQKQHPRYRNHIEKYGRLIAVDALDALHPDVLKELVLKSIDNYYNLDIYKTYILDVYGTRAFKKGVNDKVVNELQTCTTTDNQYDTPTIILAFGKTPRDLNVPGEKEFKGKGVSYCAVWDGLFLKIKPLVL